MTDKAESRSLVQNSYNTAVSANSRRFKRGEPKATEQFIYPNQKEDAHAVVDMFYKLNRRVVSVQKKTKIGADGLMIEIARIMSTHSDDDFVVDPDNVLFITGMSNLSWEKEMKEKMPCVFKNRVFHHGKLRKLDLKTLRNGLVFIDEVDTANGENQVLHTLLKD